MALFPSFHRDTFARHRLPPESDWPTFLFDLLELKFPPQLNCAQRLLDDALEQIDTSKVAVIWKDGVWSYAKLAAETNRICHALLELEVEPGNRVLLRGNNSPLTFAAWLAIVKIGAIAVCAMPMLRSGELGQIVEKANISLALCETDLGEELSRVESTALKKIVTYGGGGELEKRMAGKSTDFAAVRTSQDDVCVIAFTSGTTGQPKATMHFHRDVMAMCETFARHMIPADSSSIFTGTPPIAFTFGLGALLVFPLYFRAAIALPEASTPVALANAIQKFGATHIWTSPTAYKAMVAITPECDFSTIQICVSAGEMLSAAVSDLWFAKTGIRLIDGIGGTEMMHIFISACGSDIRVGSTGRPVPGYIATLFDKFHCEIHGAGTGLLGVRGPTGCRYLDDPRQKQYVVEGWNMTGDIYRRDEDGYYWFVARADDMIVSSAYNIAGPEVETALLLHPMVQECAVIGWPNAERGQIVKAFVVLKNPNLGDKILAKSLQDHVKATLAPYKYPRDLVFVAELPKTATGKLLRNALRPERH